MNNFDFDNALSNVGIVVNSGNTTDKNTVEEKYTDKIVYGLTDGDRNLAVQEFLVPKAYKDATFDENRIRLNIKKDHVHFRGMYKVRNFYRYINICNSILCALRLKKLPDKSYIIGAPNGFGKTSFANEAIMILRKHNFRVVPYTSLYELSEIRKNEQEARDDYKFKRHSSGNGEYTVYVDEETKQKLLRERNPDNIWNMYSYSEYLNADCLFVYFTSGNLGDIHRKIECNELQALLNIRGNKGLPTIVMLDKALKLYKKDDKLVEYIWNEIEAHVEKTGCYDRVFHISCYKEILSEAELKDKIVDEDTGIIKE